MRSKQLACTFVGAVLTVITVAGTSVLLPAKPTECRQCGATDKFMMSDDSKMIFLSEPPEVPGWTCCNCGKVAFSVRSAVLGIVQ